MINMTRTDRQDSIALNQTTQQTGKQICSQADRKTDSDRQADIKTDRLDRSDK